MGSLRAWLQEYYGARYGMMIGTASGASPYVPDFSCNAHYQDLNLDAVGKVNLCGKLSLGDLNLTKLSAIWSSAEAEAFSAAGRDGPWPVHDVRLQAAMPFAVDGVAR